VTTPEQQIIWSPQPGPQTALIACPVFEVFFGGARGGGKTEGSIGDWLDHSNRYGASAIGVFFRRKFKQLEEVVARTKQIFPQIGAKYNETKAEWVMPAGGRLKFRYIERDSDAEEYQGHSYTRVYVEEATNFPSPAPINLLRATLRSPSGVPTGLRLTGNPGGPGHHWVKKRYIDPARGGWKVLTEFFRMPNGDTPTLERVFIPSRIADNVLLMRNDPTYVLRLQQSGSEALVRAWLEGDWDIVDGAYFDCWDESLHVLKAGEWIGRIPKWAIRFRAMDWGSAKPFSVGWYAVSDGTWGLPDGALLKYRQWYGSPFANGHGEGNPDTGLKLGADAVARGILQREAGESIAYGVAGHDIFIRDGGPPIAEVMFNNGVHWRRADIKRIPGWEQLRVRLRGWNGTPMIYFLDSCYDTIRVLPILQHDDKNQEDVDQDSEDHPGDETRYAVMSRPWIAREVRNEVISLPASPVKYTINELVARQTQKRKQLEMDLN